MSKGEVKNPAQDQRIGNKSGRQGRDQGSSNKQSTRQTDDRDMDADRE